MASQTLTIDARRIALDPIESDWETARTRIQLKLGTYFPPRRDGFLRRWRVGAGIRARARNNIKSARKELAVFESLRAGGQRSHAWGGVPSKRTLRRQTG